MIWTIDYINVYLSAKKNLNHENVESLNAKQIEHIGKMYKPENFKHYKKQVFFRWFSENSENTPSFIRRVNRILNKIDIELSAKEREKISNLEPREFTTRRAMKTIEVPYKDDDKSNMLELYAFFFYKDVRLYSKEDILFKQTHKGELWISKSEIVMYDRGENAITKIIHFSKIKSITLRKFAVEMTLTNDENIYLRYKDNELLFISLNRSLPNKVNVDFLNIYKEESDTAERTIEHILNL